jgi:hypothetical protein
MCHIGRTGVVSIENHHLLQQFPRLVAIAQTQPGLRAEKSGGHCVSLLQIVFKQKHAGKRGCKIIDLRHFPRQRRCIGKQGTEQLLGLSRPAELLQGQRMVIRHL